MNASSKPHVIITGMHRSGTSFLVRALNLCGLHLGPESDFYDTEINPKIGNPSGHWENVNVNNLNEEILKINEGTWDNIPINLKKSPENIDEKIKLILTSFHSYNALGYGFKDPRFLLTLEKWIQYLPNCVLIGIFRHPIKVAESLKTRNNFDYEKSLSLWEKYNQKLLSLLKKQNGFLIDFDWPKEKLLQETLFIAEKLNLPKIDIDKWFSEDFKHSDKSYKASYKLSNSVLKTYEQLQKISQKNHSIDFPIPKIKNDEYRNTVKDLILRSNTLYENSLKQAREEFEKQKTFVPNPMGTLLNIFYSRKDLQKIFPEVLEGDYSNLIKWARRVSIGEIESENTLQNPLSKFSQWFEEMKQEEKSATKLEQDNVDFILTATNLEHDKEALEKTTTKLEYDKEALEKTTTNLEHDKEALEKITTNLEHDKEALEQGKEALEQGKEALEQGKEALEQDKVDLEYVNFSLEQTKEALEQEKNLVKKELNIIKSGIGFKIIRFLGSKIDKFKAVNRNLSVSKTVIENEGVGSFLHQTKEKIKKREFTVKTPDDIYSQKISVPSTDLLSINVPPKHQKFNSLEALTHEIIIPTKSDPNQIKSEFSISIVIPTNSSYQSILPTINGIYSQKGIKNLEIILVNSGPHNLDSLKEFPNLKIIKIKPEEFNHGTTRNLGARDAEGEFIIFLTDDAVPLSDYTFNEICSVISNDPSIAVASGRQIPRSDSGLIYQFLINAHYAFLGQKIDRLSFSKNYSKLDPVPKRKVTQIDDVFCCYRKEIFYKYRYKKIQFAEDLDMGIRLVKDGYKIAQLFSIGVVHSHSRPSSYYVKRGFVDTIWMHKLLSQTDPDIEKIGSLQIHQLVENILSIFNSISKTLDLIKNQSTKNIISIASDLKENIPKPYSDNSKPKTTDNSLNDLFNQIFPDAPIGKEKEKFLLDNFFTQLAGYLDYLRNTHPNISNIESDFFESIYQYFGLWVGSILATFKIHENEYSSSNKKFEKIEKILIGKV